MVDSKVSRSLMGYDITLVPYQQVFGHQHTSHELYISGARAARNEAIRHECKIYAILTIGAENSINNFTARNARNRYMCVGLKDMPMIQISRHFPRMLDFISQALQHGNVLVHCTMGVSRSATVVVAFIMRECRVQMAEAYKCLEDVRPYINPNPGFMLQLREWERQCSREVSHI